MGSHQTGVHIREGFTLDKGSHNRGGVNIGDCDDDDDDDDNDDDDDGDDDDDVWNSGKGRNRQMAGEVEVETLEGSIKVASG